MLRTTVLKSTLIAIAFFVSLSVRAIASDVKTIDVPAGDLTKALETLAKQSAVEFVYRPEQLEGLQTKGARGMLSAEEAVTKLLEGTTLTLRADSSGILLITAPASGSATVSPPETQLSSPITGWFNRLRLVQADTAQADSSEQSDSSSTEPKASAALEEVVVTAQKREESIQDVPASITALGGDFLTQSGVDALDELSRVVPGLGIDLRDPGNAGKFGAIAIRGIGTNIVSQAQDSSVAIVKDGVVLGQAGMAFTDYNDIERIEVLRGPQGTLFGMNATAGVLNIVTKDPTREFSGNLGVGYGSYNELRTHGAISGPIAGDTLLGRLAFYVANQDGYLTNIHVPNSKEGSDDQWGIHGKLVFLPRDETRIVLNFDWTEEEARGDLSAPRLVTPLATAAQQSLYGPFASETNATSTDTSRRGADVRNRGVSLQWDETIGDHTLTSITAWRDRYHTHDYDPLGVPNQARVTFEAPLEQYQISEELRIASPTGGLVDYVAGLFVFKQQVKEPVFIDVDLRPTGTPIVLILDNDFTGDSLNTAVFGDVNFHVTDSITLIVGTRWTRDKREMHMVGLPRPTIPGATVIPLLVPPGTTDDSATVSNWSWRGGVRWEPNQDNMVYGTASRGFKGPGFNQYTPFIGVSQRVDPEIATSYELGWKAALWSNRVRANVALFFTELDDFQAQGWDTIELPDGTLTTNVVLLNAGKLESKGVEFELEAVPLENLSINFNTAYIDAKFKEFPNAPCYFAQSVAQGCVDGVQDLAGKPLPATPEWSFNVSGRYDIPIPNMPFNGFGHVDYSWRDEVQWRLEQSPLTIEDAYGQLGASIGIQEKNGRYTLRIFGKNLTGKFHTAGIAGATVFTHFVPKDYQRIFGIAFDYQF